MYRRYLRAALAALACVFALALLAAGCSKGTATKARPNVVVITLDTTRYDHIGCCGSDVVRTPNIDTLAAGSVQFDNCFSTTHSTNPSHTAIFTSLYMRDHGVLDNKRVLPDFPGFMPKLFKAEGYRTAGMASGGHLDRTVNINQGFDDFFCPNEGYEAIAGETTDIALKWLDDYAAKSKAGGKAPFFLWVHYFDPHFQYRPPAPYDSMYKLTSGVRIDWAKEFDLSDEANRNYMASSADPEHFRNLYKGEVSYMDAELGRLLERLKEAGVYDDTVVVVVADHGESLGEHGVFWDHRALYDVSIRVPLIIKPAGGFTPGRRGQRVSSLDIYPTVFELAGIKVETPIMGRSMTGILEDPSSPEIWDEVYFQSVMEDYIGIKSRQYTYIRRIKGSEGYDPVKGDASGQLKAMELYDNEKDPHQVLDIAPERPEVVSYFEKKAGAFINDRKLSRKAAVVTDKAHLEKLKALGYVQ